MDYSKCILILFFLLSWFSKLEFACCSTKFSNVSCMESEKEALLELRKGLTDKENRLSSWIGVKCCAWVGVGCNKETGHVTNLDLHNPVSFDPERYFDDRYYFLHFSRNCLGGELNPSLLNLKHLSYLDLSMNNFSGTSIPLFFGSLRNLKYLNLSSAGFGGRVPPHLGNLSRLQHLHIGYAPSVSYSFHFFVGYSRLIVDNLSWIFKLSPLKTLDLSGVYLRGAHDWLQSVSLLSSLSSLSLAGCELHTFPRLSYFNSTSLASVNLGWNNFSSTIPLWLLNVTGLVELHLDHNNFVGPFPEGSFHNLNSLATLDLSSNSFNISLPNSICELKSLVNMDLSGNYFHGLLPDCLDNLTSLVSLNLEANNFEGIVPTTISYMCSLQVLDLSLNQFLPNLITAPFGCLPSSLKEFYFISNNFHGYLPSEVEKYRNLEVLKLSFNSFSGSIPATIEGLSNLKELDISNNNFNGSVPTTLGKLSKLVKLDISNNSLTGDLSELHFKKFTGLKYLSMSSNSLFFNLSSPWIPPFQLESIELASIKVGPQFPLWLKTQIGVKSLIMWNASISDTLPDWFEELYSDIHDLDLSYNNISGKMPRIAESHRTVRVINLNSNNLTGPLLSFPSQVYQLDLSRNLLEGQLPFIDKNLNPSLSNILLYSNRLTGEIPLYLCEIQSLTYVDLSSNQLSGRIPSCLANLQKLIVLDLSNNNLGGQIPYSLGYLVGLYTLHLQGNKLVGELPSSFQNMTKLHILDLGDNKLKDIIPPWIGQLRGMVFLRLQSNDFYGDIPLQLCNLKFVRLLNLARNNLSGTIPHCFGNFSAMVYDPPDRQLGIKFLYYFERRVADSMKGSEREYSTVLPYLKSIELSENNLHGDIPDEIFELIGLQSLNLSVNHLQGRISENIGNWKQLESLDLSKNEFSGPIPSSLSTINSLSHLNLSNNKLSGRIPTGSQLQTLNDPSIYSGNDGLCGTPLPKICPDNEPSNRHGSRSERNGEQEIDFTWFYAGIGPGFGCGFVGFWSIMFFKKTWRIAFFLFLERICKAIT